MACARLMACPWTQATAVTSSGSEAEGTQRREPARLVGDVDRVVEVLRPGEVLQPVLTEIANGDAGW